jgi:hypothetical protein
MEIPRHAGRDSERGSRPITGVQRMSDVLFVVLTVAFFAVAALIVKGVERL